MKKLLRGAKKFMQEKIEAAKDIVSNKTTHFIAGAAIMGLGIFLGGAMIGTCFMPQFN